MTRKVLITFALIVFSVTIASAQAVGTYKATRAATVTERIAKPHKPHKPHNPLFLGVNAGINGTVGTIQSLDFTLGADIAFSTTEKFAYGYFIGYETLTKANYGLLFVHGNYVKGSAFFWGLGYSYFDYRKALEYEGVDYVRRYNGYRFLLRLGYKSESFLYYNVTLSAGSLERKDHYSGWNDYYFGAEGLFGAAVTVGYRFNTKLKTN